MTTQDWTIYSDLDVQRKIREFDIDLEVVTVDSMDNEVCVEISDEIIPSEAFFKLVEMMKKEYKVELNSIEPLYYTVKLVFSPEDKEADSQ